MAAPIPRVPPVTKATRRASLSPTRAPVLSSCALSTMAMAPPALRPSLAGDELREGHFGPGAPHDLRGVVPLVGPLLLEVGPQVLEEQGLHADHRLAPVLGDHGAQPHRLGAELRAGDEVIEQTDAMGLLGLDHAAGE